MGVGEVVHMIFFVRDFGFLVGVIDKKSDLWDKTNVTPDIVRV